MGAATGSEAGGSEEQCVDAENHREKSVSDLRRAGAAFENEQRGGSCGCEQGCAGGDAGLFTAIIPGWMMKGPLGSDPVTKEIRL